MFRAIVVEDEVLQAMDWCDLLQELGLDVVGCHPTGERAVAQIRTSKVDLAVVDMRLKGEMDGLDVAEELERHGVSYIFVTAFADSLGVDRRGAGLAPMASFGKPLPKQRLREALVGFLACRLPVPPVPRPA
jgi:CheY-like chemotaxis protein